MSSRSKRFGHTPSSQSGIHSSACVTTSAAASRVSGRGIHHASRVSEASALLFGSAGRLEIGKRMGLPDILTGYAPNSFTFTVAESGPPTGRSLDPGGGLQTQFLRRGLPTRLEPIASQGVTASQFNDESTKILYVLPKHNGWLGGVSFATFSLALRCAAGLRVLNRRAGNGAV